MNEEPIIYATLPEVMIFIGKASSRTPHGAY